MVDKVNHSGLSIDVTLPNGQKETYTIGEADARGLRLEDVNNKVPTYAYTGDDGKTMYTTDYANLPATIKLNEETGDIEITAPKMVYESESFKQAFDDEQLKKYSQAYKLNPEYKISVTEKNENTGEDEEKEVTIPEYIERLNSSFNNYMENLRTLHAYRDDLKKVYGSKVDNLTDEQLNAALTTSSSAVYLPDAVLQVGSFGNGKNPFLKLINKVTEDGLVSTEELKKVYTRSNFGREEMAALLAAIDGALRASGWDTNNTYKDEEGNEYKNSTSATEAMKLLSFRNYITNNNPKGEAYQQMGDYIESFINNAAYQTTKVFGNLANFGEAVVTGGEGRFFQNNLKQMDEAMNYFNENETLVWDAVANAQVWGSLAGVALGTWGAGKLIGAPFKLLGKAGSAYTSKYLNTAMKIGQMAEAGEKISLGARMTFKAMTAVEKVNLGINMATSAISGLADRNFFVEYVFDTMHDAILYDSTGLRDMMDGLAKEADGSQKAGIALTYWAQQYADNAKWWGPMGAGRAMAKTAGKTTLGKATNIVLTKYINKAKSALGTKFKGLNGDVVSVKAIDDLNDKLRKAENAGEVSKANRIKKQIDIENQQAELRRAKAQLGNVKLEWDGLKLTEESAREWRDAMTHVKAVENGIDAYIRGVDAETRAMLTAIKDPSTGKPAFLYEELAGANIKASKWYYGLVDLNKKYGMSTANASFLNQDVVDYWQGSFKQKIYQGFADAGSEHSEEAAKALVTINENLESLKSRLPEEITSYIDDGIKNKVYQDFYKQLNRYGVDNRLLVKETIDSYEANPIWAENGYMPLANDVEVKGRWISEDDKIETIIEQEMDKLRFHASPNEHFKDPELVRQVRIRHMAQAKVNSQIWKSYSGYGSDATNITIVSGEETEFARKVGESQKALETTISKQASASFAENMTATIIKKKKKPSKNIVVDTDTKSNIVSSMSPNDIAWYLTRRKGPGGRNVLSSPDDKLTNSVTRENFDEWYSGQSREVKNYLWSKKKNVPQGNPYGGWSTEEIDSEIRKVDDQIEEASKATRNTNELEVAIQSQSDVEPNKLERAILAEQGRQAKKGASVKTGLSNEEVGRINAALAGKNVDGGKQESLESAIQAQKNTTTEVPLEQDLDRQVRMLNADVKMGRLQEAKQYSTVSYDELQEMIKEGGDDFEDGLRRAWLMGNETFGKSSFLNAANKNLADGKEAFFEGVILAKIRGEIRNIPGIDTDTFLDDLAIDLKEYINLYLKRVLGDAGSKVALKALVANSNGGDDAARFIALNELLKKDNLDRAKKAVSDQIGAMPLTKGMKTEDVELLQKKSGELLEDMIKSERDDARIAARTMDSNLGDSKDLMEEVKAINKRIKEADERLGDDYVMYLDDQGRKVYAQVDPAFASLFNYRYRMEKAEASVVAKLNAMMSRAYRYGTTSVNLSSFGNQLFRDFGNALLVGGSWQTIKYNANNLKNVFGKNIIEQIKMFEPREMERIEDIAEKTGRTVEDVAVSRELMRGAAKAPSTTERTLYKTFMREAYAKDADTMLTEAKTRIQELIEKWNPEDLLNGKRENYLRNRVFASNLNDAIKQGYTLEQSRVFAEFAMNNATTNFTRQLYHLQAIADSTPYFRAAINGHKSFWRMWSLDPVGISGRIMGGLIIPTMYLTGASMATEKDREIYMNIPEYEKQNSMVFVFNGQAISIPIPQEMGQIVAPFRQFVEYLHNANKNDFWELMMNDLLGYAPIDLQGFSTIDMDQMISDPTIFDRIQRGTSRLFSSMAPVPMKTAYMLATGIDPYSGKNLRDRDYMYWNDETNSVETMDYNDNAFAQWIASIFGDWMSPDLAEKVVSGTIGTTGSNVLGAIARLVQENGGEALKDLGKSAVEQITKPFDIKEYNYADAVWKRAIKQLNVEKQAILNDKSMKVLNSELSQTKDVDKRKKLLAERQTKVDEFHQKVQSTIERLNSVYGGIFDRKKLAAVTNLLNFNSDPGYQTGSQYSSAMASEEFWNGRKAAVHTMERMGVTGTHDTSIFGYLIVDEDGNPIVKYSSPVAIMDMDYQWSVQDDIHAANIKALISEGNLYDAHKAVSDQINKIYGSKKKLTNQDYANIEAIQINWNAQLAKTIAPYVAKMTPEAAINSTEVMNALYPYVEVPGSWEKNNSGKSASLGDRGNKKKAYYESWIKSMFSVNDPYKGQY